MCQDVTIGSKQHMPQTIILIKKVSFIKNSCKDQESIV